MAPRKTATVGSLAWISNERSTFRQLEDQDVEDIAYSVRNEMDWLNEYMANIFERNPFDMAEIMKTPGRLRGKTPRTVRKPPAFPERESLGDIFSENKIATPRANLFRPEILNEQHSTPEQQLLEPQHESSPRKSPVRSSPRKPLTPEKVEVPVKDCVGELPRSVVAPSMADSGFYTSSQANSQVLDHFTGDYSQPRGSDPSQIPIDTSPGPQSSNGRRATRQSFRTAQEPSFEAVQSSPVETVSLLPIGRLSPQKPKSARQFPEKPLSPIKAVSTPRKPRRSERLTGRASDVSEKTPAPELVKEVEETKYDERTYQDPVGAGYPALPEPGTEAAGTSTVDDIGTQDNGEATDHVDPSPPHVPVVRKSSMNLASLPAREPLTNKKSIREGNLEQLMQSESKRTEWIRSKSSGKSLGGSSKPIVRHSEEREKEKEEERGKQAVVEPKTGEKRRSESKSSRHRKMSRGNDVEVHEVQETVKVPTKGGDDGLNAAMRLHNKTSTQRLHDRIQQMGKLSAARTARQSSRSIGTSLAQSSNPVYPDLSAHEDKMPPGNTVDGPTLPQEKQPEAEPVDARPKSAEIEANVLTRSTPRPQLMRSETEHVPPASNGLERSVTPPRSPRWPSPIKTASQQLATLNRPNPGETERPPTLPRQQSPMSSPYSPLKTVAYASVDDVPQFLARAQLSPKKTPTTDNTLPAVKAQTSTALRKAKEMWAKSSLNLQEILKQEKEELKRREEQERKRRQEEEQRKAKEPTPGISDAEDTDGYQSAHSRVGSVEPERPQSRLQQQRSLRFQRPPSEAGKRALKSTKEQPTAKPPPMSVRVGTASQREMQDQRNKTIGSSGQSIVSALKSTFEPPQPSISHGNSQTSLQNSSSTGSLRRITNSKQLKSLQSAAAQKKKEQEDRERKAAQKKEIERRRAENQRKQEEEQRRLQSQKQRTTQGASSTSKTLSRVQPMANLRQTSQEPEAGRKPGYQKTTYPHKRTLTQEVEVPQTRNVPSRLGVAGYQQDGTKKRRTGEHEERPYEAAPPIHNSLAKKELVPKQPAHGYAQTTLLSSQAAATMKPLSARVPPVESVKFSQDKLKFAGTTPAVPSSSTTPSAVGTNKNPTFRTPATRAIKKGLSSALKESPLYPPGESIVLPDIPTDSEDGEDSFMVPDWAESPELRQLLKQQQAVDPQEVFGPMAKLDMEAIFKAGGGGGGFRARTSSANWSGQDRLTQAEIQADQEARRKLMETGKWKFPGAS